MLGVTAGMLDCTPYHVVAPEASNVKGTTRCMMVCYAGRLRGSSTQRRLYGASCDRFASTMYSHMQTFMLPFQLLTDWMQSRHLHLTGRINTSRRGLT